VDSYAIEANALSKTYRLYATPWQRVRNLWGGATQARQFVALDNVTLRVARGSALGVLGPNGAGKSTLLKILSGVIEPTSGSVIVRGTVGSILELGAGFHPEFTGRENLLLNAALLGYPPERTREIIARVEEFCELGPFLDLPVRTYSSGMFVRLAFSAAIAVDPDVLLVDEALAVGDAVFAHRCLARVHELRARGCTIVFVTHDTATLTQVCDRAILLANGAIVADGAPKDVVDLYLVRVAEQLAQGAASGKGAAIHVVGAQEVGADTEKRFGSFHAEIVDCAVEGADGRPLERIVSGTPVRMRADVRFHRRVENPVFGVMIKNRHGVEIFGTNTQLRAMPTGTFEAGDLAHVCFDMPLMLGGGTYAISFAVHTADGHFFDYRVDARLIEVIGLDESIGIIHLPVMVNVLRGAQGEAASGVTDLASHLDPDAPWQLDMSEQCDRFLADEWHTPQRDAAGPYRWMGREGLAFAARGQGDELQLEVETFAPDIAAQPLGLRVLVNGVDVVEVNLDAPGPRQVRAKIPPDVLRPINTITLVASRCWSPAQHDPSSGDARQLSVLVRRIAIP
jgi:ABC-type polysaccharide/polyol phosphate transport system ATPase subunit